MSEDNGKGPGGRPPAFPDEYMEMIRQMHPDVTTRRGRLNVAYRIEALDLATPEEREAMKADGGFPLPPTVLTELGRCLNEGWRPDLVRYLWELVEVADPTARDACQALRHLRNSKADEGTAFGLFVAELESVSRSELEDEWWDLDREAQDVS